MGLESHAIVQGNWNMATRLSMAAASSYVPQSPQTYIGNQVILNSDRLVFNAKSDSILHFADKGIGFSTNGGFNFDGGVQSKFVVNTTYVLLGMDPITGLPEQPAVLGFELLDILDDIIDVIGSVIFGVQYGVSYKVNDSEFTTSGGPETMGGGEANEKAFKITKENMGLLKDRLGDMLSKKVKIA